MTEILKRKTDHIDLVLKQRLELAAQASPWDEVQLTHNALPEQDLLRFDLSTEFLGKRLRLPFLISSMTAAGVDRPASRCRRPGNRQTGGSVARGTRSA